MNKSLWNTSTNLKGTAFVFLTNHANAPIRKKGLSPKSKARREARQNKFVQKKGRMPNKVKSFREINSGEDRPRARLGFVKPIRNGLRKEQNVIESRPSRPKTDLAGRENGTRLQKGE